MNMRRRLARVITQGLEKLCREQFPDLTDLPPVLVEVPKIAEHGDFATNAALTLTKLARRPPRQLAEMILGILEPPPGMLARTEIAGPGFINFFLTESYWLEVLKDILREGEAYGNSDLGRNQRVQVEFVSANPTGPLHVGHGRGAALGDALANILTATGHQVTREYYINDVGTQIRTLGLSLSLRLRQLAGEAVDFPETCYQGDYMVDLARRYRDEGGVIPAGGVGEDDLLQLGQYAGDAILEEIKGDLEAFGVRFDTWFSEGELFRQGRVEEAFEQLRARGFLYEAEGALWFKATAFGDEKDRVVRRQNGLTTYFASDIAYHWQKFQTGNQRVVDIWGADHHGYVPRLAAAVEALGVERERLQVILVQLVSLLREGQPVAMTTRGGTYVTLREVIDEVGKDAARFIYLSRRSDAQLEFDLELAKKQSSDNPVYYVQYAHARLASVFRTAAERGITRQTPEEAVLALLNLPEELALLKLLSTYPDVVEAAARHLEPHRITYFLTDLAAQLHSYYYKHRIISDSPDLTQARLHLVEGIKVILDHGLKLLGVEAPDSM